MAITVDARQRRAGQRRAGAQATTENTAKVFCAAIGNLISVADVDAGTGQVRVSLSRGQRHADAQHARRPDLRHRRRHGRPEHDLHGHADRVNAALNGLTYSAEPQLHGQRPLSITTNDQGNTGSGGALADTDTVSITVTAVNEAPVNTVPGPQTINEDITLVFSSRQRQPDLDQRSRSAGGLLLSTSASPTAR